MKKPAAKNTALGIAVLSWTLLYVCAQSPPIEPSSLTQTHLVSVGSKMGTILTSSSLDSSGSSVGEEPAGSGSNATGRSSKAYDWAKSLKKYTTKDAYHMSPVRVIHARIQRDPPKWDDELQAFLSRYGRSAKDRYISAMDTVNTASVDGALMYVQAEGINYNTRASGDRCKRKNEMKFVVFYDIVIAQTNETLALYQSDAFDLDEYGPMVPMDKGRCAPTTSTEGGEDTFPPECYYFNGDKGAPPVGPFVGGEDKSDDVRAPYPNNVWYSFPNTCPLYSWEDKRKTNECRAQARQGLCDYGNLPDGVTCTYSYRILGWVSIDDVVGITSMRSNKTGEVFKTFEEFCEDGGVEFLGSVEDGSWEDGLDFWKDPHDTEANAARTARLLAVYGNMTMMHGGSTQIDASDVAKMVALPSPKQLASLNPPCYKNVKKCNTNFGCKRERLDQRCTECTTDDDGCVGPAEGFTFPSLKMAKGENGTTGSDAGTAIGKKKKKKGGMEDTDVSSATRMALTYVSLFIMMGMGLVL